MTNLRKDLKKHRDIGFLIGFVVTTLASVGLHETTSLLAPACIGVGTLLGVVVGYVVGWLKEYWWDAKGHGTVDAADLRWTYRGAALGAAAAVLILHLIVWIPL